MSESGGMAMGNTLLAGQRRMRGSHRYHLEILRWPDGAAMALWDHTELDHCNLQHSRKGHTHDTGDRMPLSAQMDMVCGERTKPLGLSDI